MDGELCLSIHPLDFMTMSDNANDWDSCMTWMRSKPGDYRAGTVECMNSPYIIVAYLHNPKHKMEFHNGCFWNSKKWRELFIVNQGVISEIKGYPYQDENLTNTALMWIKSLAEENLGWTYNNEELNVQEAYNLENGDGYMVSFEPTYHMYNDFGSLKKHRMRINASWVFNKCVKDEYNRRSGWDINSRVDETDPDLHDFHIFTIPYGGIGTCMCCGRYLNEEENRSEYVLCKDCYPGLKCACCGAALDESECIWVNNSDDPLCEECYDENSVYDSLTGETYILDASIQEIYWLIGYDEYNEPVFYDDPIYVYEPEYNTTYNEVFSELPKRRINKYGSSYSWYITLDMVKNRDEFQRAFNIWSTIEETVADYLPKEEPSEEES